MFQGHGAEQGWLPFFAEGDRRGKLLPFQPYDCPSLFSGHPPSVGQQGSIGPVGGYADRFQDGPRYLGECGPCVYQCLLLLEPLAALVSYLNCYLESSHSCPLHLANLTAGLYLNHPSPVRKLGVFAVLAL